MAADDAGLDSTSRRTAEVSPWLPAQGFPLTGSRGGRRASRSSAPARTRNGHANGHVLRDPKLPVIRRVEVPARISSLDVEDFLHTLRQGHEAELGDLVDAHVARGVTLERVYLELLAPAARRLGELWEEDCCDYFQVTLLVGRMQGLVHQLGPGGLQPVRGHAEGAGHSVLLAAPHGEQHTLGLVIVGELFLRGGWSVAMGTPLDPAPSVERVSREFFDLVGLSVSRDATLEETRSTIRDIRRESRNRNVRVILGGRAFGGRPETVRALGADSWASDGAKALAVARQLCGDS